VKEISSTYNRFWNYDGRIKGLNPYLRQLECENITAVAKHKRLAVLAEFIYFGKVCLH
jgi:hypothetical protein